MGVVSVTSFRTPHGTGSLRVSWGKRGRGWAGPGGRAIHEAMLEAEPKALYQRFLPGGGDHAYVWKYSQSVGGRRPRHFHPEPELNLVIRGSATFGVGEGVAHASAGELLAFPAGQDHVLLDATEDLYLYAIGLDPAYSAEVLGAARGAVVPLHVRLGSEELTAVVDR